MGRATAPTKGGVDIVRYRCGPPRLGGSARRPSAHFRGSAARRLTSGAWEAEELDEEGNASSAGLACAYCTGNDAATLNRFMEGCDTCERWYHGPCVSMSKAAADADFYAAVKEAEGNEKRLTPAFLEYAHLRALANNTKVYFGCNFPLCHFFLRPSPGLGIECLP